jgi:hypothetical protein
MAAKSIINELYQRLRTAAPVYCTTADEEQRPGEGFDCALTLPAVLGCEWAALAQDRVFQGKGSSKKVRLVTSSPRQRSPGWCRPPAPSSWADCCAAGGRARGSQCRSGVPDS